MITSKIESLLREGISEWDKWLKRTINISFDQVAPDWPTMREIFIRRNMLVHTKGEITERYLTELRRAGGNVEALSVGQTLAPSVRYVQESLQRLIALEVLLVFKVGSRIEKQQKDAAAEWLVGKLDFLASREMWQSVCLIVDSFDGIGHKRDVELSVKINGWLGHKNHDDTDGVSSAVSAWDVSALDKRYAITKKLLLDTLTPSELTSAMEEGRFTQFEFATHPLFAHMRESAKQEPSEVEPPEIEGGEQHQDEALPG